MNFREIGKVVLCLGLTCLLAGLVLGITFAFTEPAKEANTHKREQELIRSLLSLKEEARVVTIERFMEEGPSILLGYRLPRGMRWFDLEGKVAGEPVTQKPPKPIGRFFVACDPKAKTLGYVAEASQFGFKSHIRFFVALSNQFEVRGVEVISHEEDPGLGAEITRPAFKNQFVGKTAQELALLEVTKDPSAGPEKIHAVTGATISSRALTEGVQKGVAHLKQRLEKVLAKEDICGVSL